MIDEKSKLFRLRPLRVEDDDWLVDLHNDPEVLRNLTNQAPITLTSHREWRFEIDRDPRQLRLIFEYDNSVPIGLTKFYDIDKDNGSCGLGADIHKNHRGNGHAKHMWSLMLDKCFKEMRLHRVWLTTAEYNAVGIHVYTKLGFKHEGKLTQSLFRDGMYHDQHIMYMLDSDWLER